MQFPKATRRLLFGYGLIHLVLASILVLAISAMLREVMIRDTHDKLDSMASLMAQQFDAAPQTDQEALLSSLSANSSVASVRMSLVSSDGTVVGGAAVGESLFSPELFEWARNEKGPASFRGDDYQRDVISAAHRIKSAGKDAQFIFVETSANSLNQSVAKLRLYLWLFAIGLGILMSALMTYLTASYLKPLPLFAKAARNVGEGDYKTLPAVKQRDDEWGALGDAFEQMQKNLVDRESVLVENSQRLEAVLSSMIEGVLAIEPDGHIMLANGAACRMLSFHREKMVGRKLAEVVRIPELSSAIEKSQRDRTFSKTEFKTLGDDSRTLKARVSMLADEDESGLAVVLHDVTELRQLETMRQDFVANVSHELKTPLASIKAYAETLRLGAINDESRNLQFLEQIEFQADTLNQQIQDLLQLARVESGEKTFSISDIDVNQICESLHRQFLDSARKRNIEIELLLSNTPLIARADADAIKTVVKNLIVNAIHYTPEDGRVSIQTALDDNWVVISVMDTGIGISPEHQSRVFERFYRVDQARSRDMGGTGLGLAIVKHLTQAFGGTVALESQLGKGSKFHVRLRGASK